MVCDLAPWRVKCSVLRAVSSRSGSGAPRRSVGSELSLRRWFIAPSIPQTYRAEIATPAPGKAPLSMQSSTLRGAGRRSDSRAAESSTPLPRPRQSAPQDGRENDRVVVVAVAGGIDAGKRAVPCPAPQLGEPRTLLAKLLDKAAAELLKAARLVPKPLPQLG